MQSENFNPMPGTPPARRPRPLGKTAAIGCGVPLLGLIFLFVIGSLFGDDKPAKKDGSTPAATTDAPASAAALARYTGKWQGQDGTSVWIRGDGKGDFDAGSTKVQGGGVTLDEKAKTLRISSFFGMGKTWQISQPPHTLQGNTEMTLDSTVYRRGNGFDSGSSSTSGDSGTGGNDAGAMPTPQEQQRLVRESLWEFDRALRDKDFSNFYKVSSKKWQEQTTAQELKTAFQGFIDKKIRLTRTLKELKPTYDPAAHLTANGMLEMQGYYPTQPYRTYFKLGYLNEDGIWKLSSFHVKIGDPIQ